MPKISIIMPVYNSVEYLKEAIDSILSQTFMDWEFIIINEFGSNDGSKEIIEQYAKVDNRFILIQNESRLGISESMNMGLQTAKGEYIARMDADDISLPKRFEKQIEYMDKHPEIAMCGVKVEIFGSNPFEWKLETNPDKLATNILFYSPSVHPTIMIRKSFLDKYGIKYNKDYKASEDYDLFSQICQYGKVANINEVLFRYRIMENNATFKNNDIGLIIYNKVMQLQFQRLELSFDEDELNLLSPHLCMKGAKGKDALIRLSQLDLLLKKILVANDKVKLYQIDSLMMTLHKRFKEAYDSISWACSGVDLKKADEIYNKSIFAKDYFYKPNHLNKIKVTPTVSVLLPTYNSQKYIMDTIWSILEQTYDDFELIILNEFGSNDDTVRIAEMFQDPRIRIIQNTEKKGLAESLNIGIKEAKGKYLARIDADDLCDKNRFKLQVQFLDNNLEYGVCGSWQHHFGINTDWIHRCSINHDEIAAELLYNCDLCHSTLMLRKEYFVKNNLFYDNRYAAEDYELWTRAIKKFKFANIPQILGEYRVGEDNITSKKMEQLSQESGELAARNLEYYFGIKVPENHILMLSGWRNEISRLEPKQREIVLKQEKKILYKIWEINKSQKNFDDQSLLKTLNKRWRSITNTWQEDNIILELNDLFKMYRYGTIKNKLLMPKQKLSAKKIVKKILSSIFRPIKYRTVDVIQQQLWDMDGHLGDLDGHIYDYKGELKSNIDLKYKSVEILINDRLRQIEKQLATTNNEQISDQIKECQLQIKECQLQIKECELQIKESLNEQIKIIEQNIIEKIDNCMNDYLNQKQLSDRIFEAVDRRIWQAENNIYDKIWAVEGNLKNYNKKTITLIENQINIEVEKNYIQNKIPYALYKKIRVVFLFQVASFWSSFESLWNLLKTDERFDVTMLLCDQLINEPVQMQTARGYLKKNNIEFVDCFDYNFDIEKPHIVFYQTPYDEWHRPKWLWSTTLKSKGIRIAYIPYGIGGLLDSEESRRLVYTSEVATHAWKYYTISEEIKRKFQQNSNNGGYAVTVVGHTKLDALYYSDKKVFMSKINDKVGKRKIIIWLMHFPHHIEVDGKEILDTPSLEEYSRFSEILSQFKNMFFIVRPHPKFFEMSRWIKGGLEFTENIKNNILQSENAILDDDDEYHSKLKCGDAFIVDASSLAVEVGALNKPVIYMKSLEHPIEINEVYKPLIESYIQGKTCNDIVNFLKDCEKGLDINQDVRANSFKSVIPYYDGKSAERIRDNLIYSLENDL